MTPFLRRSALALFLSAAAGMAWAGDNAPSEEPSAVIAPEPLKPAEAPPPQAVARQGAALLQMFQTFCRDTHSGAGAVIAAAERDGYGAAGEDDMKAFAAMELRDLQIRARVVGEVRRMVASGHGQNPRVEGRPNMDICIVSISPGGADAAGAFGQWVGVEPVSREAGQRSVFMFLEGPEGRQAISTAGAPSELRRRMRDGDLQMLMVGDEGDATMAIYGVMRPEI